MRKVKILETLKDVKALEVVSSNVSDKYVPIYTSELIKILQPEFQFEQGVSLSRKTSQHYVDLTHGEDTLRIFNSYDRTFALRMAYVGTGIPVDLGVDRLIHIGKKAKTFIEDTKTHKDEIVDAIKTAKKIDTYLGVNKVIPKMAKGISDIIFNNITSKEGFQSYVNYIDLLVPKGLTIKSYINQSIIKYNNGDYNYTVAGTKKTGLKKGSAFNKIVLEKQIMDFLTDEYIELMI